MADRPPIERYVRCSVTGNGWTVEPGIEWRTGDDFDDLVGQLAEIAAAFRASMARGGAGCPFAASEQLELAFANRWPGRAFFVEVHDEHGHWTQIFQPYGVPRHR